jgi:hypothetical protein
MQKFSILAAVAFFVLPLLASPVALNQVKRDPEPAAPPGSYVPVGPPADLRDYRVVKRQTPPTGQPVSPSDRDGTLLAVTVPLDRVDNTSAFPDYVNHSVLSVGLMQSKSAITSNGVRIVN